jgi:hypothetical protein
MKNRHSFLLFVLLIVASWSCNNGQDTLKLPIPREKLRAVLMDLYLAGSAAELHPSSNKDSLQQLYLTEICKIHGITPEVIASCNQVMQQNLKMNAELQKEVLDSLNLVPAKRFKVAQ